MTKKVIICLAIVTLAGCEGIGLGLFGTEVVERDGPLLPFEVGSTWTYEQRDDEEASRYTATLAKPQFIDGERLHQLQLNFGGYVETGQFVTDSTASGQRVGTVFLYRVDAESAFDESQFFKYPIESDKATYSYTDVGGDRFTYTVEREEIETPAGTFVAYTYSGYDADPNVSISLAPGIGVVRLTETGSETVLAEYKTRE
jgi:hypothetical protein